MVSQQTSIFTNKPKLICPNPTYFLNNTTHKIVQVSCGSWHCPICSKKKASKLQHKTIKAATKHEVDHGHVRFLTLTIPKRTDEYTMMSDLNNLLTQLRKQGYLHTYFWVKEFTPPSYEYTDRKGRKRKTEGERRHLHLIWWGRYIPWQIIERYWEGKSDLKRHSGNPVRYLIKYLGDSQCQELFDHNERRYSSSRNFYPEKAYKPVGNWSIFGSWMEGYHDISVSYDQQINDYSAYKEKFKVYDYNPDYQKALNSFT